MAQWRVVTGRRLWDIDEVAVDVGGPVFRVRAATPLDARMRVRRHLLKIREDRLAGVSMLATEVPDADVGV